MRTYGSRNKGTCAIEGCVRKVYCKLLCNAHWQRKRLGIDMTRPIRTIRCGQGKTPVLVQPLSDSPIDDLLMELTT